MVISPGSQENIGRAAGLLKKGGIVAFPTETVYGLGADCFNPGAVTRIFEAKKRPFFDPLIVHVAEISWLHKLCDEAPPAAVKLAEKFWPGPLTVIVAKNHSVPDIVTAGLGSVAVRMPSHPVARDLIIETGSPIAAPSANPFGYISPTRAEHVLMQLGDRVDMILDGGECSVGVESTIVRIEPGGVRLLRPGGITPDDLESVAGPLLVQAERQGPPQAPGQLPFHYSPMTPVCLVKDFGGLDLDDGQSGFIFYRKNDRSGESGRIAFLSENGDLHQAAANLFSVLHRLDGMNLTVIYAEEVPCSGLGIAIMDRLTKASKRAR
ncbi:MAG TPA: L-threonylcarbamoyladenylate synthase [Spirochaetota bacterium]|nr:L-threonylcarbamoyladenylate synthase [Spirochaetota bacterium]HPI90510.1 L-threonylcarbamoyladenylate synthase [Spirochaetota bacterium]HPR46952.1 L-threonylcarbamoyladenylate synthase [Spirochaetota bacterium]